MKIDIFYSPVYPQTRVKIDGKPIDETDIYGFLYPVRNYILQAWLPESGSWHGFEKELRDITRGEAARIVFHGRKTDYEDFQECVRNTPNTVTEFSPADYVSIFRERLSQAEELSREITEAPVIMEQDDIPVKRSFRELYPNEYTDYNAMISAKYPGWLSVIESKSELGKYIGESTCCLINGDSLLSSDDYTFIDQLTASLARSYDMIICRFLSEEMREYFSQYNEQLKKYSNVQIVTGKTENREIILKEKYGIPYEYRQQLMRLRNAYHIIRRCTEMVQTASNSDKLDAESIRSELKAKYKRRWCSHQKNNINELRKLLFGTDYMER